VSNWLARGLRRGILTTRYPYAPEEMPQRYRGRVRLVEEASAITLERAARVCLSHAIEVGTGAASRVRMSRCFQCGACARETPDAIRISNDFEVAISQGDAATVRAQLRERTRALGRSVMIRHVDAGSDASCEQEIQALFNPFYDINRLGFFLTATPRHADLLLVTGVVTHAMAGPLRETYDAMPDPRIVVAVGSAACSGSIFAESDVVGPVERVLPVDVKIPGAPPPPLAIIHGLWVALAHTTAHLAAQVP
jgi:Ni,Fe-hydrogenase III small subunit